MLKTHQGQKYLVTDDLEEIVASKMPEGTQVFFNEKCTPCYTSDKENANDLLTVEYCSSDTIIFKEFPERSYDFYYRRKEMYKVLNKQ